MLFSGLALNRSNTDEVVVLINKGILFIAPQVTELRTDSDQANNGGEETASVESTANPHLATMLENFIEGSRSATVGVLGSVFLLSDRDPALFLDRRRLQHDLGCSAGTKLVPANRPLLDRCDARRNPGLRQPDSADGLDLRFGA